MSENPMKTYMIRALQIDEAIFARVILQHPSWYGVINMMRTGEPECVYGKNPYLKEGA